VHHHGRSFPPPCGRSYSKVRSTRCRRAGLLRRQTVPQGPTQGGGPGGQGGCPGCHGGGPGGHGGRYGVRRAGRCGIRTGGRPLRARGPPAPSGASVDPRLSRPGLGLAGSRNGSKARAWSAAGLPSTKAPRPGLDAPIAARGPPNKPITAASTGSAVVRETLKAHRLLLFRATLPARSPEVTRWPGSLSDGFGAAHARFAQAQIVCRRTPIKATFSQTTDAWRLPPTIALRHALATNAPMLTIRNAVLPGSP